MRRLPSPLALIAPTLIFSMLPLSCVAPDDSSPGDGVAEVTDEVVSVPSKGTSTTLDIGEWNLEWFGSTLEGPSNESLQLSNARDVISGANLDIWAVEEVVSTTQFNQLLAQLPGYTGFLANAPTVLNGSSYYSAAEQKVGIVYKSSVVTVKSAKVILTGQDYNFAGRPPLEVSLTATINGVSVDLIFIALHAKAGSDSSSYTRRQGASAALKTYLDGTYPTQKVIVVGDFNDDVDTSITTGLSSPYKGFVDDSAKYFFPTKALTDTHQASTASYSEMIDHHMLTNELKALYVASSAVVYRVDQYITSYSTTTSDHFPTLTRYSLGPARVILNEICANEPGADVNAEFIELVNVGGTAADLSGWTLWDATGVRHTFPSGKTLAPGAAVAVFGGSSGIPAGLSNAVAASAGGLSLNNGGDTVTLKDSSAAVVDSFAYTSNLASTDGASMNRSPDGSAGASFVMHTTLSLAASSPGTRVDGSGFGG
jgi:endonuclease/exonuclease/phosphatase family metal-dependent hydrolase